MKLKRIVAFLLILSMCLPLSGCKLGFGGDKDDDKMSITTGVYDSKELVFEKSPAISDTLFLSDGKLFFVGGKEEAKGKVAYMDMKTEEIELGDKIKGFCNSMAVVDDSMYVYSTEYDAEGKSKNYFQVYDTDLKKTGEFSTKQLKKESFKNEEIPVFMAPTKDGLALCSSEVISVTDFELNVENTLKLDTYVDKFALSNKNELYAFYSENKNEVYKSYVAKVNLSNGKFEDPIEIKDMEDIANGVDDYTLIILKDDGLYGLKGKEDKKFLDYNNSDIDNSENSVHPVFSDIKTGYYPKYIEGGVSQRVFIKITKGDDQANANKKIITVGSLYGGGSLEKKIVEFNKKSKKYRLKLVTFSEDGEDDLNAVNTAFSSGDIPDVIDFSSIPISNYASKGLLEDMTSYLENDSELNEDDFLESVFEAMKIDGKLYTVSSSFNLTSLIIDGSRFDNKDGWTYDEFFEAMDKVQKDDMIYELNTKNEIFNVLVLKVLDDFIDLNEGKCSFDSDNFKKLLEFCNKGKKEDPNGDGIDEKELKEKVKNHQMILFDFMGNPDGYCASNIVLNNKANIVGYPNENGNKGRVEFNISFGMYSKSKNKEGAWEFIREYLTDDFQKSSDNYGIPTRKDTFENYIKPYIAKKKYKNEADEEISPMNYEYGKMGFTFKLHPLTDEEEETYRNLVDHVERDPALDPKVKDIISEEVIKYFNGDRDVDETCKVLQNRINTYINEIK